MSGFHFSSVNHAMVSENPSDSINLFWNQQMEKNRANAISFFTPNFDATIGFEYPEFGMFGNNLLNPMLAIQQTMQSFQNGSWMNGSNNFGSFGNFGGFGNFGFGSPWGNFQFPWAKQDGQGGSGKTAEEKLQYSQYDKMKKILNEYKKVATDSEKAYIEEAMSKSGKIDEKIKALKDVAAKLDSSVIKESLLSLDPYKTQLIKSGYKVNNNDADKTLKTNLKLAAADLKAGKVDTLTSSVITNDKEPNILNILSTWNDTHNTTSDRNIIRLVASNIPSKADEQTNHKKAVEHIAKSLLSYAENIKTGFDADVDFSQLDKSAEEVATAWADASKNFNKDNVNKLAAKVDDLYARLRLIEAEKIRNNIQKDYKFVNDMTGKTIVDDGLIVKETEKDLKTEGITLPTNRDAVPSGNRDERAVSDLDDKPVDEQIAGLTQEKSIAETNVKKGIYKSKNSKDEKHHLYMKKDDKLVELKDVVSIDKDNNCKMKDGSTKKLADVEKVEVSPSEIKQYNATLKKIEELKNDGKLVKCPTNLPTWNKAGVTLYWSKGRKADGAHQCFVVMGNELMQIDCKYVDKNGKIVMEDGTTKGITELTENDCSPANRADVLATDEPKEKIVKETEKTETESVEIDANATPAANGKIVRERLRGDSSKTDYDTATSLIKNLDNYSAEEVVNFIEGYNNERGWKLMPWNGRLCAQISTEEGMSYMKKDACLRAIAKNILKVMDELPDTFPKNSYDYSEMKKYSQVGLDKNGNVKKISYNESCEEWRAVAGGWKSWSFWSSERTGAANHMDDIIKRVLEQYRKTTGNSTQTEETKAE